MDDEEEDGAAEAADGPPQKKRRQEAASASQDGKDIFFLLNQVTGAKPQDGDLVSFRLTQGVLAMSFVLFQGVTRVQVQLRFSLKGQEIRFFFWHFVCFSLVFDFNFFTKSLFAFFLEGV